MVPTMPRFKVFTYRKILLRNKAVFYSQQYRLRTRSRSHLLTDSSRAKLLSNGLVKEPIVTRSKSRLKGGRRQQSRSPKKSSVPSTKGNDVRHQRRKQEKGPSSSSSGAVRNNSSSSSISSPASPRTEEKMYARHFKSYRGLNGIRNRRNDRPTIENRMNSSLNNQNKFKKVVKKRTVEQSTKNQQQEQQRPNRRDSSRLASRNNLKRLKNGTVKNHIVQNGISKASSSSEKLRRSPSTRIRQLVLRKRKQRTSRKLRGDVSPPKSPGSEERSVSPQSTGTDKAGKRRSAVWVLNCEAESFLFGETAAEKHEVELPPLPPSPPPKKRRCRATELGELLEKSPILESKLRKSSSSESGTSDTHRDFSPPRKRPKPDPPQTPRRGKAVKSSNNNFIKRGGKTPEMCSSNSVNGIVNQEQPPPKKPDVLSPRPELLSPIPFLYSPDSIDYEAKTLQFQQMLTSLDYGYTFENPPRNEPWYNTFTRNESSIVSYTSFENILETPIVLPYEMDKPLRRSRTKPAKNSRKSPRCHASTLAMLSSERPVRSTRSSVTSDTSPTATLNNLPSESTLQTLLLSPGPTASTATASTSTAPVPSTSSSTAQPQSTSSTSPPSTSKRLSPGKARRRRPSSSPKPTEFFNPKSSIELGASEYLWDSIQYLSDNYVVGLLSGDDLSKLPEPASATSTSSSSSTLSSSSTPDLSNHKNKFKNHRCTNNNYVNCPVKHFVRNPERSARKASLRSGDSSPPPIVNNLNNSSKFVSTPKSSPRNQSHLHQGTNNHVGSGHHNHNNLVNNSSPPASPTATLAVAVNERVPPVNGISRRFTTSRSPPISPPTRNNSIQSHQNNLISSSKLINNISSKNSKGTSLTNGKSGKLGKISSGDNGLIPNDKLVSKTKSAVVLVTDLFNGANNKIKTTAVNNDNVSNVSTNNNKSCWEEESLFTVDGLPSLFPQWPA